MPQANKVGQLEAMTMDQHYAIQVALIDAIPNLSYEEAERLIKEKWELIAKVRELLTRFAQSETPAMAVSTPVALPEVIKFTLGGHSYEVPRIIAESETVKGREMLARAMKENAILGKEDAWRFIDYQREIPTELRGKVSFVFVDWRHPDDSKRVAIVFWYVDCWTQNWGWLESDWLDHFRPVRRSTPASPVEQAR